MIDVCMNLKFSFVFDAVCGQWSISHLDICPHTLRTTVMAVLRLCSLNVWNGVTLTREYVYFGVCLYLLESVICVR